MFKQFGIMFLLIFLSIVPVAGDVKYGILLKDIPENSFVRNYLYEPTKVYVEEIVILPSDSYDEKEVASIIARIGRLPAHLLEKIYRENIKLHLINGKITEHSSAHFLAGKMPRGYESTGLTWDDLPGVGGTKDVLVKIGCSDQGQGHGSVNLELHELAHSIDYYIFNDIHHRNDFLKIWQLEREVLFPNNEYFINFPEEYFAEIFAMFYLSEQTNEKLQWFAPFTYSFLLKNMKD